MIDFFKQKLYFFNEKNCPVLLLTTSFFLEQRISNRYNTYLRKSLVFSFVEKLRCFRSEENRKPWILKRYWTQGECSQSIGIFQNAHQELTVTMRHEDVNRFLEHLKPLIRRAKITEMVITHHQADIISSYSTLMEGKSIPKVSVIFMREEDETIDSAQLWVSSWSNRKMFQNLAKLILKWLRKPNLSKLISALVLWRKVNLKIVKISNHIFQKHWIFCSKLQIQWNRCIFYTIPAARASLTETCQHSLKTFWVENANYLRYSIDALTSYRMRIQRYCYR